MTARTWQALPAQSLLSETRIYHIETPIIHPTTAGQPQQAIAESIAVTGDFAVEF
jgi:hypothetical protein